MFKFGKTSLANLNGVHPALVKLAQATIAAATVDFRVIDGMRTLAEEKINLAKGVSQTMNSLHLRRKDGYAHAIDFVALTNGQPDWFHISNFLSIVGTFKEQSKKLKIPIICGADWKSLKDYGHIELDRKVYPI